MPEHRAPGIIPPVKLASLEQTLFSIDVTLPPEVEQELAQYAAEDGNDWTAQAKDALMFYRESFMTPADHARENTDWAVRNFGPPKPVKRLSHKQWIALNRRVKDEASECRANGSLGNLILPEEIYGFVRQKIGAGEFTSPAELLSAAMPFLREQRGKPKRAELYTPSPTSTRTQPRRPRRAGKA